MWVGVGKLEVVVNKKVYLFYDLFDKDCKKFVSFYIDRECIFVFFGVNEGK